MFVVKREVLYRAQGCFLGQVAGDALGSLVEFKTPEQIKNLYPDGLRNLAPGGPWRTIAGQPTDDSEMALVLARTLIKCQTYDQEAVKRAYLDWLESEPFGYGRTVFLGLTGTPDWDSESNGALMRVSPLGIFGTYFSPAKVFNWACLDAAITHPKRICREINGLFAMALAYAIRTGCTPCDLYGRIIDWAKEIRVSETLMGVIVKASSRPPSSYIINQGWVLTAFQNAIFQLLHAASLEEGIVDTVMEGGDTDTNGAIVGALLGSLWGREAIPKEWTRTILNCRPASDRPEVARPRPEYLWPVDILELSEQLVTAGLTTSINGIF